jgi:hypothetical protein
MSKEFTHELVNEFDLLGSLARWLVLLSCETGGTGVIEGGSVAEPCRTDRDILGAQHILGLFALGAPWRQPVEDYGSRSAACVAHKIKGCGNSL